MWRSSKKKADVPFKVCSSNLRDTANMWKSVLWPDEFRLNMYLFNFVVKRTLNFSWIRYSPQWNMLWQQHATFFSETVQLPGQQQSPTSRQSYKRTDRSIITFRNSPSQSPDLNATGNLRQGLKADVFKHIILTYLEQFWKIKRMGKGFSP